MAKTITLRNKAPSVAADAVLVISEKIELMNATPEIYYFMMNAHWRHRLNTATPE
jgi:hypothetical protein